MLSFCLCLCAAAYPTAVVAQIAAPSANFDVSAGIVLGCSVNGSVGDASGVQIGTLDFGPAPARTATELSAATAQTVQMRCTPGTNLRIRLNGGNNPSATTRRLRMGSTSNMIDYRLCRDAACAMWIGNIDDTTRVVTLAEAGSIQLNYYAKISVPSGMPPGLYTDDIMVTLSW